MFKQFLINNFRCFATLALNQLKRVNLIAGKNNTGKTALLEAIHLHNNPANWQLPIEINKQRGIANPSKAMEDVCSWLFHDGHVGGGLALESRDEATINRTLTIMILDPASTRQQFPEMENALAASINPTFRHGGLPRLILKYEQNGEEPKVSIGVAGTIAGGSGGTWIDARISWTMPSVYLDSGGAPSAQDEAFFGKIETAKRQGEILPALRIVEPRLQRLALVPIAGESVIHGDIGLSKLVPIPFMGEGIRRVLSIVLAIANAPGGVVLIDEVENGLHYSVMKDVWKAAALAARQMNVQVFATTHNWECILHAHEAFSEDHPYDLGLHRLDRLNGDITMVTYDKEMIETALRTRLEIR